MIITAGSLNVTVTVYFVDDVSGTNTGEPTTGLLFSNIETGGSASFQRQGEARTDFTLVTVAVAAAHTDGGFILIDDTECPGLYRLDVPDGAFATGVDWVMIYLRAASGSNTIMRPLMIDLTVMDLRDGVRAGLTSLPNVVVEGVGGLYTRGTGAGQINQATNGQVDVNQVRIVNTIVPAPNTAGIPDVNVLEWLDVTPNALVSNRVDTSVGAMATNVLTAAAISTGGLAKIVDGIIDEPISGGHHVLNTLGHFLRAHMFSCQVGDASPSASAFAIDQFTEGTDAHFEGSLLIFTQGVLSGQARVISVYTGSSQNCTFDRPFTEAPGDNNKCVIIPPVGVVRRALEVQPDGMSQADLREWLGTAVTLGSGAPDVNIQSTDNIALSAQQKLDVNVEALDVIATDTIAELGVGIPASTPTVKTALALLYMALRNKVDVDSSFKEIHNDANTIITKKALSDDATTYSEAKAESG